MKQILYKAFISYSHRADSGLAPQLQFALQAFGKPWYSPRAFRIFRDTTNLSLVPELWPEIEKALAGSEFLLFLASPEAAASKWAKKELSVWKQTKCRSKLLIILTAGKIVWDDAAGDFHPGLSTAIPAELYGTFTGEPLWLDFSHLDKKQLATTDPLFLDHIATVAAPLHGKTKDEIFGEHIRQRQRTIRWIATAATLLLAALLIAIWQRQVAVAREVEVRATLSTADYTTATGRFEQGDSHGALLHLIRAVEKNPGNTAATQSLISALANRRWPVLLLPPIETGGPLSEARFLNHDKWIASASLDGGIRIFDSASGQPVFPAMGAPGGEWYETFLRGMTLNEKNGMIASYGSSGQVYIWSLRDGKPLKALTGASTPLQVAEFSPDGAWLASLGDDGLLRLFRTHDFSMAWEKDPGDTTILSFSPDSSLVLTGTDDGEVAIWRNADGSEAAGAKGPDSPVTSAAWSNGRT